MAKIFIIRPQVYYFITYAIIFIVYILNLMLIFINI